MSAVAYIRVSTDEQAASGLGLDAQRDAIRGAADRLGLPIRSWHGDEGISGTAPLERRYGLLEAIEALGAGDTLLVAKRDRLARDMLVAALVEREIRRRGASIVSAAGEGNGDDPASQLTRRLIDAVAEYECAMIRLRTRAALAAKRRRGEKCGGHVPYGYRLEGAALAKAADEQAVLADMAAMRAGGGTFRGIAAALNRRGVPTRTGAPWSGKVVSQMVAGNTERANGRAATGS